MKNKIVLAVGAHPDDMDFNASGTIARWIEEGATAYYLICTDGSCGSSDPDMTHEHLAEIRKKEQHVAAKILGLKDVFFLNFNDTQLECNLSLKERISWHIRKLKPNIVVTMDPTFFYAKNVHGRDSDIINHSDHRAAAAATMDAVFPLARDRLTFPEHEKMGLESHKVEELYFSQFHTKDTLIDISTTFDKKMEALFAHTSQFEDTPAMRKRMRDRARKFAEYEVFELAESFTHLKMPK